MKILFLVSLIIPILFSCTTTSDNEIIRGGYSKYGLEAQEYYINSDVKSPRVLYNLAYSYLETDDFDSALECATTGQELYPEYLRFYTLEAYCHKRLNDKKSYQETLKNIIDIDPGYIDIWEILISSLVETKDKDNAIKYAKELLQIDPSNKIALNVLSLYITFYRDITGFELNENKIRDILKQQEERLSLSPTLAR